VLNITTKSPRTVFDCAENKTWTIPVAFVPRSHLLICLFPCWMCNKSKLSPTINKKKMGQKNRHGTRIDKVHISNFICVVFLLFSLVVCWYCIFHAIWTYNPICLFIVFLAVPRIKMKWKKCRKTSSCKQYNNTTSLTVFEHEVCK
jgi:hypothetical protein